MTPIAVTKEELLKILREIQTGIEKNDSFEGSFSYTCLDESCPVDKFMVEAVFRMGNSMGQGGSIIIGSIP
jgi:hypothetical protein